MSFYPIKTETDYEKALAEIESIFQAVPDTPEGDRLEVLATLVEAYELKHYPILPPDSIDALLYHIESRGLSRRDLESYIGYSSTSSRSSEQTTRFDNRDDPASECRARHSRRSIDSILSALPTSRLIVAFNDLRFQSRS